MTESIQSNNKDFTSLLSFLVSLEQRRRKAWEEELINLPKGSLCIAPRGEKIYFQHTLGGSRRGITHDLDLVYKLARKRYLQVRSREHRIEMQLLGRRIAGNRAAMRTAKQKLGKSGRLERLLERYGKAGLDILRITCTEAQYRWAKAKYRSNPMHPENKIYETYSGIKVRSKSEQSIGNALELRGIPYRYEMELDITVDWMEDVKGAASGKYKKYYPDFIILTATGNYIIWEHLGRVDLEAYRTHNMEKIAAYRQDRHLHCEEDHLILTFERDMERTETVEEIIARRVLPYV